MGRHTNESERIAERTYRKITVISPGPAIESGRRGSNARRTRPLEGIDYFIVAANQLTSDGKTISLMRSICFSLPGIYCLRLDTLPSYAYVDRPQAGRYAAQDRPARPAAVNGYGCLLRSSTLFRALAARFLPPSS